MFYIGLVPFTPQNHCIEAKSLFFTSRQRFHKVSPPVALVIDGYSARPRYRA